MTPRIYTSSFRTGENATKKQQMLFATDTAYALSEGYQFIKDCDGDLFQIVDEHNLLQVSEDELFNQSPRTEKDPTVCSFNPDEWDESDSCNCSCSGEDVEGTEEDFLCLNCDNIDTIDLIIYNTLNQVEPLRSSQLDSLIKLAKLKLLLVQSNG